MNKEQEEIDFDNIKDGDLFKIIKFTEKGKNDVGKIAQRYGDALILINERSSESYDTLFKSKNLKEWKAIIFKRCKF